MMLIANISKSWLISLARAMIGHESMPGWLKIQRVWGYFPASSIFIGIE